jgi:hypothetical protein
MIDLIHLVGENTNKGGSIATANSLRLIANSFPASGQYLHHTIPVNFTDRDFGFFNFNQFLGK